MNFRQGCMGAPAAAEESENKQLVSLLAHPLRNGVVSLFLIFGEGRGVSRGQAGVGRLGSLLSLMWCCVQAACAVHCLPGTYFCF